MITILTTTTDGAALTKKLIWEDGQWTKEGYARAFKYDVVEQPVHSLYDLAELLMMLEGEPKSCVIRGRLRDGVSDKNICRLLHPDAGTNREATFEENPNGVQWLMLDFDEEPAPEGLTTLQSRLDYLISLLPDCFDNVSYYYQWSAGAGLDNWETINAHLWFWLSEPWLDSLIIERIEVEKWNVDEAPVRTVQPNYTAAPIFVNASDFLEGERSGIVLRDKLEVHLPPFIRPKPEPVSQQAVPAKPGLKFEQRLAEIGPRFHRPIIKAVACYVGIHGSNADKYELKNLITDAMMSCGYPIPKYAQKEDHFENAFKTAISRFGRIV